MKTLSFVIAVLRCNKIVFLKRQTFPCQSLLCGFLQFHRVGCCRIGWFSHTVGGSAPHMLMIVGRTQGIMAAVAIYENLEQYQLVVIFSRAGCCRVGCIDIVDGVIS